MPASLKIDPRACLVGLVSVIVSRGGLIGGEAPAFLFEFHYLEPKPGTKTGRRSHCQRPLSGPERPIEPATCPVLVCLEGRAQLLRQSGRKGAVSAVGASRCLSSLVFAAKLDRVLTRDVFEILVSISSGHDFLNLGARTLPEPKATAVRSTAPEGRSLFSLTSYVLFFLWEAPLSINPGSLRFLLFQLC